MPNLITETYYKLCNELVLEFAKKQDIRFSYWVADNIGETACFIDEYFFNMNDIVFDLENNIETGKIIEWQNHVVDESLKTGIYTSINYKNYLKLN